jgi:hypothetical protein
MFRALPGSGSIRVTILWHICSKEELWSQQRRPLLGNGYVNTLVARQWLGIRHVKAETDWRNNKRAVGSGVSYILSTVHYTHIVHLCVAHGSQNKRLLLSESALTGWYLNRSRFSYEVIYLNEREVLRERIFWLARNQEQLCPTQYWCLLAVILTVAAKLHTSLALSLQVWKVCADIAILGL